MPANERWISKFQLKPNSWVFVPSSETITYGRLVKELIESHWSPPRNYYHLRDGGHIKALFSHVTHKYFVHIDIQDFFGCINRSRVTRVLKRCLSYFEAREIANASTVKLPNSSHTKYILPFGFVQSPVIASICLYKSALGQHLNRLNKRKDIVVSIYMDDIIISGDSNDELKKILKETRGIAHRSKFMLNQKKEEGPAKKITAFNIELSHKLLEISSIRFNEFYSTYLTSRNIHQRYGIISYVSTVNLNQAHQIITNT